MKFDDLPIGTLFRFDCKGLPRRLAQAQALGPFRKVAGDGAVHIADQREFKWYVAPATNVAQIEHADAERDS
jgi:hypothetical protein